MLHASRCYNQSIIKGILVALFSSEVALVPPLPACGCECGDAQCCGAVLAFCWRLFFFFHSILYASQQDGARRLLKAVRGSRSAVCVCKIAVRVQVQQLNAAG